MLLHIVMLQWFSAECWPLIGRLVSGSFLQNYQPHRLHTWYTWPPRWDTEPYCILLRSSDFLPNAGLWLVDWYQEIFSKTISPIDFILGIHDLLCGIQNAVAYHRAPVIFRQMLASDRLFGFGKFSPKLLPHWLNTWYTWPPRWGTDCYCISSCLNDFSLNAALWLVDTFPAFISTTTHHIAFIFDLWTHTLVPNCTFT